MSWRPHLSYNGFISWAHQSIAQSIMLLYSWPCHVSHSVQILIVSRGKVRHSEDRGHRGLSRKQFHFLQLSLSLFSADNILSLVHINLSPHCSQAYQLPLAPLSTLIISSLCVTTEWQLWNESQGSDKSWDSCRRMTKTRYLETHLGPRQLTFIEGEWYLILRGQ